MKNLKLKLILSLHFLQPAFSCSFMLYYVQNYSIYYTTFEINMEAERYCHSPV